MRGAEHQAAVDTAKPERIAHDPTHALGPVVGCDLCLKGWVRRIHAQGVSLLIIEHVMRAIMALSQRIVVLHHGEKIAEGQPDAVARDARVVEAYLGEAA